MPKTTKNILQDEKLAEEESEVSITREAGDGAKAGVVQYEDEEAEEALLAEKGAKADPVKPAELAAIHRVKAEPESKLERRKAKKEERQLEKQEKAITAKPASAKRSHRYQEAREKLERGKLYSLEEAIELVKEASLSRFDGAIELHLNLAKRKGKGASNESTRGLISLPHGTGKKLKAVVLDEEKIEQIAKSKKLDFDVAIATPALMPKVAKIARILGPKGKMPEPKTGTVTDNPEKVLAEIDKGRLEYRVDDTRNVHLLVGKVSWASEKLLENARAIFVIFPSFKLSSATLAPTIGPAVPLDLTKLK